ncbi:MAG: ABC transporter permease subunit, partial [Thaumarchaeota archaeon]|nr:ABC transporter permease subunit [Nitrososphaerota archaeon]
MRLDGEKAAFIVLLVVVGFLTVIPLTFVAFSSFWSVSPGVAGHLTFLNYFRAYSNPLTYHAILNTFIYSLGATSVAAAIGIPFSWFVSRTNTPFARFLEYVSIIPYMIPGILYAIAWVFLLNPNNGAIALPLAHAFGLRNIPFNIYSLGGMIWVDGLTGVPLIVIFLSAAFKNQDSTLEDSASITGAGKFQIFRSISLPLVLPAILAAISLNILRYFELFEVPAVIGLPGGVYVLSTLIYGQISGIIPNFGYATVLGITAILVSMLLVFVYRSSTMKVNRFATITGKGRRLDKIDLGRWKYFTFAFCLIVFLVSTVLPTISLILGATLPYWGILSTESLAKALSQASLNHFYFAFSFDIVRRAFVNSFIVSTLGATIGMILALFIGQILTKSNMRGKSVLEQLSFAPFARKPAVYATPTVSLSVILYAMKLATNIIATITTPMADAASH